MTTIDAIYDDFAFLDDWEDRYRYIIDLGEGMPPFPESARNAAHKVRGCVSQVWLKTTVSGSKDDPTLALQGDSDSHIVKGLVAIVIALFSDRTAGEILRTDAEAVFSRLGLDEHLTPQRANGLRSMVKRIYGEARAATAQEVSPS